MGLQRAQCGPFWRATLMDTRLRAAHRVAKTETEAGQQVFETLKRRGIRTHLRCWSRMAGAAWMRRGWRETELSLSIQALDDHRPGSSPRPVGRIYRGQATRNNGRVWVIPCGLSLAARKRS